jgi:hypothetical protein
VDHPLRAPLEIEFDYTRPLGPVLSQFMTGLKDRRILGARGADGRVHAPPFEYDPVSAAPPGELTEVGPEGTVVSWSWRPEPLEGQPLAGPFAWALIRLDGADTAMLHAVSVRSAAVMRTGLRVRARWAASRVGSIRDLACFEPCDAPAAARVEPEAEDAAVAITVTPIRLHCEHTASPGESAYLRGLADRRLLGQRCGVCGRVYVPPRGTCPADGVPTREEVELPETGTVTLWRQTGIISPLDEIDVAEIYVPFSWYEPMWLENLGFAEPGQGWRLTEAGQTALGGRLPVNPSGGVLSSNPIGASGLLRFAEAALQVMGKAGAHQVPGARTALGHAYGGGSQFFSMWVVSA